jgi:hypothetical protein
MPVVFQVASFVEFVPLKQVCNPKFMGYMYE